MKANRVLYKIRRIVAVKVKNFIKHGLYKSLIPPILLYGISCLSASRAELQSLENFPVSKKSCQMDNRYKGIMLWKSVTTSEYFATSNVNSNE